MCFLQCSQHLFLTCVTYPIRLGFSVTFPSQGPSHYLCHCRLIHGKNAKKIWMVLWHSVVWNLWLLRNSIIFSSGNYDFISPLFDFDEWCYLIDYIDLVVVGNVCSPCWELWRNFFILYFVEAYSWFFFWLKLVTNSFNLSAQLDFHSPCPRCWVKCDFNIRNILLSSMYTNLTYNKNKSNW